MARKKDTRSYHKVQKFSEGGLVQEDGSEPDNQFRELRTPAGWEEHRREQRHSVANEAASRVGASGRSIGEHILAGARAVFEGTKFRENEERSGTRDKTNPLYDRKKAPDQ
jgi:hypothetical protein